MSKKGRPKEATEEVVEEKEDQEGEGFIAHPDTSLEEEIVEEVVEDIEKPKGEEVEEEEESVFKLEEEKPAEEKKVEEKPETIEIIHDGQAYNFTKDKIINLAQKGFDYDRKVGPHGKLVQMIETDPNLAQMINNYWQGKLAGTSESGQVAKGEAGFKVKPLEDYETETEWFQDNLQNFLRSYKFPTQEVGAKPSQEGDVKNMLKMRDPANFNRVFPKMMDAIPSLSVRDYQRIDNDLAALCQFYDFVKDQEMKKSGAGNTKPVDKPGFRVRSGGGEAPRDEEKADYAWNLNKEEFQKQLDKVKGYQS